jgi:hypothetical protein
VADSCEHGNESSGSIKCGEFLDCLSVLLASQEGLCSLELVSDVQLSDNHKFVLRIRKYFCNSGRKLLYTFMRVSQMKTVKIFLNLILVRIAQV